METFVKVVTFLIAVLIFISCVYFSGLLSFHHFHIVFDDGTEYHIRALIDHDAENILIYNIGSMETIPINDRSFEIHYCDCKNSVSNIQGAREIYK